MASMGRCATRRGRRGRPRRSRSWSAAASVWAPCPSARGRNQGRPRGPHTGRPCARTACTTATRHVSTWSRSATTGPPPGTRTTPWCKRDAVWTTIRPVCLSHSSRRPAWARRRRAEPGRHRGASLCRPKPRASRASDPRPGPSGVSPGCGARPRPMRQPRPPCTRGRLGGARGPIAASAFPSAPACRRRPVTPCARSAAHSQAWHGPSGGPVLLALRALGLRGVWEHVQQRDGAAQPMPRTQEEQAQVVQPGQPAASLIGNGAITPLLKDPDGVGLRTRKT